MGSNRTILLSTMVGTSLIRTADGEPHKEVDWKSLVTVAKGDPQGRLLPLQSVYDETIRCGKSFILDDHHALFKAATEAITNESGKKKMLWAFFSNLQHHGVPLPKSIEE